MPSPHTNIFPGFLPSFPHCEAFFFPLVLPNTNSHTHTLTHTHTHTRTQLNQVQSPHFCPVLRSLSLTCLYVFLLLCCVQTLSTNVPRVEHTRLSGFAGGLAFSPPRSTPPWKETQMRNRGKAVLHRSAPRLSDSHRKNVVGWPESY